MSEVRLQVKNLCKNFGITKAVQNVSFNVNKGEVHALIGENGSGKSTLTNMLTGIYSIGSGTFILDGKEVHPADENIVFDGEDTFVKDTWTGYVSDGDAILAEPEDYMTLR